ncbi:hypothetical protein BGZ46_007547 [Entomortierella lignicola]|nr:hypothetical protein BGZ46_007547 [Entomortierella lignicola]
MSLDTEIRRDANPTPTRFLLESGAFTPGLSLNLDTYNPFDASLKFLHTGTPKVESNPFDSSFRAPSSTVSVFHNNTVTSNAIAQENQKQHQKHSPWTDIMFDEAPMPMRQMSPGLSPSSSYSSASPSPPIRSPPPQTISLSQFHPSVVVEPHSTNTHTYEYNHVFDNSPTKKLHHNTPPQVRDLYYSDIRSSSENEFEDNENSVDHNDEIDQQDEQEFIGRRCSGVSTVETAMSALDMRRLSTMSDIHSSSDETFANSMKSNKVSDRHYSAIDMRRLSTISDTHSSAEETFASPKNSKAAKSKKVTASGSRKAKNTSTKSGSRKRSSTEEETPESKRQKFLERNRMAASKCREKKRLQTLKTIADADEITARNQALHETFDALQEEVRRLKNQILSHRDCGCDVIQKFVQTSFDFSAPSSVAPADKDNRTNTSNVKGDAESTSKGNETETETEAEEYDDDDGIIDHTTFDQLLEMDDEEDHEFSKSLVWNYFEQAEKTFQDMDEAMKKLDFPDLSRLGHFLKGSSAALGLTKVKESCEKLQHYGNRKDATGANAITNDEAEGLIRTLLVQMRKEYDEAENYLRVFYEVDGTTIQQE